MADEQNLLLYVKPGCPYCMKVLRYLDENDIQIETRNVFEGDNLQNLMAVGGKNQAPCLIINGKPLYESDDIIAYLKSR